MKIHFFMRSTIYVRNFESTLRELAARGHDVRVLAEPHALAESNELVARLCRECPNIRHSAPPAPSPSAFSFLGLELRRAIDFLRYLEPEFADAPKLRARAERNAPSFALSLLRRRSVDTPLGRRALAAALRLADAAVPVDEALVAYFRAEAPDLVLATPLVEPGAPQAEYLRAARACGIRTGLCVYSWDNLTNKGLIHDPLDLVTVWNEPMKREAATLHRVPSDRVVVTGAPGYDMWFTWKPSRPRDAFCAQLGLPPDQPYLLYLCSSKFIAPDEVPFVRRWVSELRTRSAMLSQVSVVVRPHPQNAEQWASADLGDCQGVTVWPRAGANPVDVDSRADYFDSIYHSAAVVGVNTSAQIESAIVGRGVYTVLADEFRDTQEGTLHFRHLQHVNGGLLHVGRTMEDHVAQLETALRDSSGVAERCRRFVGAFVRPHGLDEPATPRLVAALEAAAARGPARPHRSPWWAGAARPVLARLAARLYASERGQKEKIARRERLREQQLADEAGRRSSRLDQKRRAEEARQARRGEADAARGAERRLHADASVRVLQQFTLVKGWMDRWRLADLPAVSHSPEEQRLLAALAPIGDGSPDVLTTLRRWCEPMTGVCASEYDEVRPEVKERVKRDLLLRHRADARELFVSESSLLGGFGYKKRDDLYNADTLRYFVTLAALQDAGVLADCRSEGDRHVVWEIGGGWGGLARQFKTVCRDVTYLITGAPEQVLVSAVYLTTMFPEARADFFDPAAPCNLFREWPTADFLFAPESAVPSLHVPRLDLVLDVQTLHQMDTDRVDLHAAKAYEWGARYFYSQQPALPHSPQESAVSTSVARWFWLHPVPSLGPSDEEADAVPPADSRAAVDDTHVVGWRRIRT